MKMWMKVALSGLVGIAVLAGGVVAVQRRALTNGRLELQQPGASGFEKALSSLKLADTLGSRDAAYEIGKCYLEGKVTKADTKTAMWWLQKAADSGHLEASAYVGHALIYGDGIQADRVAGITLLKRSADGGCPRGMLGYGRALEGGLGVPMDEEKGNALMDRAAEAGLLDAAIRQAAHYSNCPGGDKKAFHFYQIASDLGDSRASEAVFNEYCASFSGNENLGKARELLERSAKAGFPWALFDLGFSYLPKSYSGGKMGYTPNEAESIRLIREAASKGHREAIQYVEGIDGPPESPIQVDGPSVVDDGGFPRIRGLARNTGTRPVDAMLQFDLVSPNGVILENYQKTLFSIPPGGTQMIDIAIAPYHRNARVQVRGLKWR